MSHDLKAITGIFVPSGSLITGALASGTVTSGSIGSNAVLSGNVGSGQIGSYQLADSAITSGKIQSGAVIFGNLSSGAVSSGVLADNSVVSGTISSGVITNSLLASGQVFSQRYLEQLNTGLLYGGSLSYASGASTFSIGSGLGMILVPRTGASGEPTLTYVQWNQITNQSPIYSGSVTYVSIRSGGAVQLQNDSFTLNEYLQEIVLGYVVHLSGTIINSIEPHPSVGYAGISQLDTFARVFGPLKVSGLSLAANGANLQVNRAAGTAFAFGSNYNTDINSPSVTIEGPRIASKLIYMYRSATPGRFTYQVPSTSAVPGSYDNGTGTLATVQNNSWTIQRLFYVPGDTDTMYVYYGRNEYANSSVALQNIFLEPFDEDGFTANAAVCIGYLIVRGAAANLSLSSDAVFVDAGIFRNTAGGGGGVAGQSINDLTDVSATGATNNQMLMYSAGEWINSFVLSQSIGSGAIVSGLIASGQIGTYHIAQGAITDGLIASGAVTSGMIGNNAVTSGNIASGQIGLNHLASGTVEGLIGSGSVTSGDLGLGAVNNINIASGAVTSVTIANGAVVSGSIASGSVGLYQLGVASGLVEGTQLTLDPDTGMMIWANPSAVSTRVKNGTTSIISGLAVVYISGGGGANPFVAPALANSDATSLSTFGVATANIGANSEGTVITQGILNGVNTSAFNDGDVLFLSPTIPGGLTTTKPQAPDHLLLVGYVTNAANNGTIEVAIQNGYEIDELHDVKILSGSLQSGQVLQWSSGVWWNQAFVAGSNNLGSGSVTSGAIASGQVGLFALASGVVAGLIGSGSVTSGDLGLGAVNNINIASGTVANDKLANSTITIDGSSTALGGTYNSQALTTASGLLAGTYYPSGSLTIGIASGGIVAQMMGSGSVTSNALASGSVTADALASGAIAGLIGSGSIGSGDLGIGAVNNENIASGTVANDKLANSTVTIAGSSTALGGSWAAQSLTAASGLSAVTYYPSGAAVIGIASGGIVAQMMGSGSVTTNAIASGSVTADALASGAISAIVGSGAITSGDLGIGAVNNLNVASGTLANDKLANNTVTIAGSSTALGASWAAAALTTSSGLLAGTYYPSGALTVGIASGGITSQMLADGSVNTNDIASGAVIGTSIAAATVANANLVNSAVTIAGSSTSLGGSWAAAALTTSSGLLAGTYYPSGALTIGIASGGITSQMLADGSVNTSDIASGAVGTNQIASGAVTGTNIAATTVANTNLVNSAVTIAGSSTALGGSWAAAALTTSSGLLAGTYYPSGGLTIGIASGGIVAQMMGSGSVTTNAIASGSVTANALASGAVSDIVGSGSVTSGDLGIGAVNNINVASGTLSNDKLVNSTITIAGSSTDLGGSWAAASLTAASGLSSVTYYPSGAAVIGIASGGVSSGMLANGAVVSGSIGSGQIGQFHLASGAIALIITSGSIVSGDLADSSVTSGNISSGSIGQMHLNQLLIPKMQAPGRLSVYSGAPVISGGFYSGATKIYYNPYNGSTISLFDGISWLEYEVSTPIALDLGGGFQSGSNYDIFINGNAGISGSVTLSSQGWTSGANRPPIIYKNGIPISQFANSRYLGTIRMTTSNTTEDTKFRRFVWNYDNRITQTLYYTDSTQHTYNSPTPRVWNLNSGSRVEFVQGIAGLGASTSCLIASYVTPGATSISSFESDGVFSGTNYNVYNTFTGLFWDSSMLMVGNCNEGYNYLQLMESCQSGTVTNVSMTLTGTIEG